MAVRYSGLLVTTPTKAKKKEAKKKKLLKYGKLYRVSHIPTAQITSNKSVYFFRT